MKFLILSSSRGTTMQAVLDAIVEGNLSMECLGLIADKEDRGCVEKARSAGIAIEIVPKEKGMERDAYDHLIDDAITKLGGDPDDTVIAALGWMFILSPGFVKRWDKRIVNVHPALLPAHPGAHAIKDALDAGDEKTGMTIHYIDEGVDTGEIILQKECDILPGDSEETLKERIQDLEKQWYPKVLQMMEQGEIVT